MSRKTKQLIMILLLLFALISVVVGYYFFNKGPVNIRSSNAVKITAAALYDELSTGTGDASKKYAGRVLEVEGIISSITFNQQKQPVILLQTNAGSGYVNCSMDGEKPGAKEKELVHIKGICSGIGQADENLGIKGDVYMTRCIIIP